MKLEGGLGREALERAAMLESYELFVSLNMPLLTAICTFARCSRSASSCSLATFSTSDCWRAWGSWRAFLITRLLLFSCEPTITIPLETPKLFLNSEFCVSNWVLIGQIAINLLGSCQCRVIPGLKGSDTISMSALLEGRDEVVILTRYYLASIYSLMQRISSIPVDPLQSALPL